VSERPPQTFANHARYVPLYHFALAGIVILNLGYAIWRVVKNASVGTGLNLLVAVGLSIMYFYMRQFALTVQDRVIRLEMRLRLERLLPTDLKPRIGELTVDQLIALRFASDAELPALARRVLDERIADRTTIKKMISSWNPDYLRA
jgi:hypothetical protein